ncbi:hypothetical protein ACMDCR_15985 [Labrys okinawensis]|uniref:hypothetical protein n=1 Tax=Labrys okinawensis TaxID=346911 RepID=UPI0039BC31DB
MHFSIVASGKTCPGCVVINASGQIVDETSRSFAAFLSQNRLDGVLPPEPGEGQPQPATAPKVIIAFESVGGKVQSALIIGRRIRKAGWTTVIGQARLAAGKPIFENAGCYSACTMVILGGTNRFVVPLSKVGVHQFSPQFNDGETFDAQEMNQIVRDYGREVVSVYDFVHAMGVTEAFFTTTLRTPFSSLDELPRDQWVSTGVATALLPDAEGPVPLSTILDAASQNDLTTSIAKPSVGLKAPDPVQPRAAASESWTVIHADGSAVTAEFTNPEYRVALACQDGKTAKLDLSFKELSPLDIEKLRAAAFSARVLKIDGHEIAIDNVATSTDGEQSIVASLAVKDVKDFTSSDALSFAVLNKAGEPVGRSGSIPTTGVAKAIGDAMAGCGA